MRNLKLRNIIFVYTPIVSLFLIQLFDKNDDYQFLQFIILGFMLSYLIYEKMIKKN